MFAVSSLGIKVWESLTADGSCENVLMHVDKGVDAFLAKSVNQFEGFLEVNVVVNTFCAFNSLPHNT
jgi:hypothetical protein